MSQPPPYSPSHSFLSDAAVLANFPGQALDVEFNNLAAVTGAIEGNLALIQRDDGGLANGAVTYDSLSPSLQSAGLAPSTPWGAGTAYVVGNSVFENESLYRCLVAHTSGVFASDLAAGYWLFITGLGNFNGSGTSTIGNLPTFTDTTGRNVSDSGVALASLAPLASPALIGTPTAPTAAPGTNSTRIATTAYADAIAALKVSTTSVRQVLTAPVSYNVASTGSDTNPGTALLPFLTIQHAINVIQTTLDLNGQAVTINAPEASYAGFVVNGPFVGDTPGISGSCVSVIGQTGLAISGATNATPIVITFPAGTNPVNGEIVVIAGVGGNTAANNSWALAGVSGQTAQLVNSVGNGAYTSGGTATFTSRTTIAGTGSATAVTVSGGANLTIGGLKLSSANAQLTISLGLCSHLFINGAIQTDSCGTSVMQMWSTQGALTTINAGIALSAGNYQWAQASHAGQIRWNGTVVGCVANIAYSDSIVLSDFGDFTETGGGSFQTNGYTVTAPFQTKVTENGMVQVEGVMPPRRRFLPRNHRASHQQHRRF